MSARSEARQVVGFVCEGSTDVVILRAIAEELLGPIDARSLQPETDALDRQQPGSAGGWSEVRKWCQCLSTWDELFDPLVGDALDLLVIALDLDVAVRAGVAKAPENLKAYDAKDLCNVVKGWLPPEVGGNVLIVVPVMSVEAWILAALFPRFSRPEHERSPVAVLVERKRLSMGDSGAWKRAADYRRFGATVRKKLKHVRAACGEAERFASKLNRFQRARG